MRSGDVNWKQFTLFIIDITFAVMYEEIVLFDGDWWGLSGTGDFEHRLDRVCGKECCANMQIATRDTCFALCRSWRTAPNSSILTTLDMRPLCRAA